MKPILIFVALALAGCLVEPEQKKGKVITIDPRNCIDTLTVDSSNVWKTSLDCTVEPQPPGRP